MATMSDHGGGGSHWAEGGARERSEALAERMRIALDEVAGDARPGPDWTVAELLAWWHGGYVSQNLADGTIRRYAMAIRLYIAPALGGLRLSDVTPAAVQAFVGALVEAGVGASTIALMCAMLRRAFDFAMAEGAIRANPALAIVKPVRRPRRPPLILGDDMARLRHACELDWYGPCIMTILATGMRRREALGLRITDLLEIDRGPSRPPIHALAITHQIDGPRRDPRWIPLKTASAERSVPVSPVTYDMLARHVYTLDRMRAQAGTRANWNRHGLLFPSKDGDAGSGDALLCTLRRVLARAGLPVEVRIHDLRHSFLVWQVQQGATIVEAAKLLGHCDPGTAFRTYHHLTDDDLATAAERVDRGT